VIPSREARMRCAFVDQGPSLFVEVETAEERGDSGEGNGTGGGGRAP